MRIETIKRDLRGVVLALLLIGATTLLADGLVIYLGIRRGSVIYLLAVLVSGWRFGLKKARLILQRYLHGRLGKMHCIAPARFTHARADTLCCVTCTHVRQWCRCCASCCANHTPHLLHRNAPSCTETTRACY